MNKNEDWRLTNQEDYLKGVELIKQRYTRYSETWTHDHCEFCFATFTESGIRDSLTEGFTTLDNYRWICEACFDDFVARFEWKLIQS